MQHQNIIENIRSGQFRNVKKLYAYYPVVRKWLIRNGCSKDRTRDIYQEALVVLCDKCQDPSFRLTASVETYLFAVSRNIFYADLRKESRTVQADMEDLAQQAADDVNRWQEKERKLQYAFQALASLAEKCRTILQMFYLKGFSMTEIADQMGFRSEKVAKSRKYKCLRAAKANALNLLNEK